MTDKLRVLAYPADTQGCGCHRIIWPCGYAMAAQAADCFLGRTPMARQVSIENGKPIPIPTLIAAETMQMKPDVVILQRPLESWMAAYLLGCQERGIATVVEIDDDFTNLNAHNPARKTTSPIMNRLANREWLRACCEIADLVTVSTPGLAKVYGKHGRVKVVRNRIPGRWLEIEPQPVDPPGLLWTGVYRYHWGDFDECKDAVRTQVEQAGWQFRTIGGSTELESVLSMPVDILPWVALHDGYPESIATNGAGIVPLADRPFNHSKSYIKGLEYAGVGLPFIASATPEYVELNRLGAGILADSAGQWKRQLKRLLTSADYRAECGAKNRAVAATMTHEDVGEWIAAWRTAVETRASQRIAA